MPTWDEILDALQELRALIEEIQSDLARSDLQQLLAVCFATSDEIVAKYGRPRRG